MNIFRSYISSIKQSSSMYLFSLCHLFLINSPCYSTLTTSTNKKKKYCRFRNQKRNGNHIKWIMNWMSFAFSVSIDSIFVHFSLFRSWFSFYLNINDLGRVRNGWIYFGFCKVSTPMAWNKLFQTSGSTLFFILKH